jgi:stage II sporulation protein GA (sporulation sigma-E factor processing peptidase)
MVVYVDALFGVNALVNYLLLVGTARLSAAPIRRLRLALAAALGGLYAVGVWLPGLEWLQSTGMQLVMAVVMALCAFGVGWGAVRQTVLLAALSFALGGAVLGLNTALGGGWLVRGGMICYPVSLRALVLTAGAAYGITTLVFSRLAAHGGGEVVPMKLVLEERTVTVSALIDTGNALRDPLTNRPVVVTDPQVGRSLLPEAVRPLLTETALRDPSTLLEQLHRVAPNLRLRLIPYQAVGVTHALLLAVRCDAITVDGQTQTGALAAISPTAVSDGGSYHALVGRWQATWKAAARPIS